MTAQGNDPYNLRQIVRDRIESVTQFGAWRSRDALTRASIARMCGMTSHHMCKFMHDEKGLSMATLERLCCLLDLRLVPGEYLPQEANSSVVYRKSNTVLNHKLRAKEIA